mmetsp:Transcript_30747/g.86899  ORF Transcript_30747/g.86899 Transcript_30747/m.86899 type:complete len:425 (-) Transcript_30747:94-1368(-)|eukprot:CAMPEP_0117669246 /NCGR_PEP_ID=MMETSP0804-20121206/12017_1 /TAXON_ID=1074897 /ORGANISM="Tetraselmis astigmatica, Strain CCMP880" /LENGTH=424 /DNA_ID=CAMNT_0005477265 /DNA_START=60 /DNA_END=1334 /DNA_ORIENTATION=+
MQNPAFSASVKRMFGGFGGLATVKAVIRWMGIEESPGQEVPAGSEPEPSPLQSTAESDKLAVGSRSGSALLRGGSFKALSDSETSNIGNDSPLRTSMEDDPFSGPHSPSNFLSGRVGNSFASPRLSHSTADFASPGQYLDDDDSLNLSIGGGSDRGERDPGQQSMKTSLSMPRLDQMGGEQRPPREQSPLRTSSPPPQQQPVVEARYRCSHPGCDRRWDQWHNMVHLRRMAQSHYCGTCQRSFCRHHTRISPHGAMGSCGLESACYCMGCFARMASDAQAKVEATNKLLHPWPGKLHLRGRSIGGTSDFAAPLSSRPGSTGASSVHSGSEGLDMQQQRLEELDQQLVSRQRSEANWAKARLAISDLLKSDSRKGSGKPPVVPSNHAKGVPFAAARSSLSPAKAPAGGSPLANGSRAKSPLRNRS